jgi:dihydrofolate reductase
MPKDYSPSMGAFMKSVDAALMGRKTYQIALRMGGGDFGKMEVYVFSRTLPAGQGDGVMITSENPVALVKRLRGRRGKKIWLMGGGELARDFLKEDLVDELYLGIVPVVLGEGIPLFPSGFPQRNFVLMENETFSKGLIALKYKRAGRKKKAKR